MLRWRSLDLDENKQQAHFAWVYLKGEVCLGVLGVWELNYRAQSFWSLPFSMKTVVILDESRSRGP